MLDRDETMSFDGCLVEVLCIIEIIKVAIQYELTRGYF